MQMYGSNGKKVFGIYDHIRHRASMKLKCSFQKRCACVAAMAALATTSLRSHDHLWQIELLLRYYRRVPFMVRMQVNKLYFFFGAFIAEVKIKQKSLSFSLVCQFHVVPNAMLVNHSLNFANAIAFFPYFNVYLRVFFSRSARKTACAHRCNV